MILVIDVGNTNIVAGVFEDKKLLANWRINTGSERTSDELGMFFHSFFEIEGIKRESIKAVIVSSVVPPIMYTLEHMIRKYFRHEPLVVGPGVKTGINIKYENPREVGADRIVNAVAAIEIYGGPVIIVDFGTATTFCAINSKAEYLGGIICPGIKISAEALFQKAAKLPRIELIRPETAIGKNTVTSMQSGIIFGYAGLVETLIKRTKNEMKEQNIKVIATGGLARLIATECKEIDEVHSQLTLEGLRIIYEKNCT